MERSCTRTRGATSYDFSNACQSAGTHTQNVAKKRKISSSDGGSAGKRRRLDVPGRGARRRRRKR